MKTLKWVCSFDLSLDVPHISKAQIMICVQLDTITEFKIWPFGFEKFAVPEKLFALLIVICSTWKHFSLSHVKPPRST